MTMYPTLTTSAAILLLATTLSAQISAPALRSKDEMSAPVFGGSDIAAPMLGSDVAASSPLIGQSSNEALRSDAQADMLAGRPVADNLTGEGEGTTFQLEGSEEETPPPPPPPSQPPEPIVLQDLTFAHDSAALTGASLATIANVYSTILDYPNHRIVLHAYTSAPGAAEYNLRLSERRGAAVRSALIQLGLDPSRITVEAYGEQNLLSHGNTEADHRVNRRVEVHFN